jgi:hypothetical protein
MNATIAAFFAACAVCHNPSPRVRLPSTIARRLWSPRGFTMKATWVVRWRGFDEACTNPQEAMDRRDQLEARGIDVECYEIVEGWRREVRWPSDGRAMEVSPASRRAPAAPVSRM